MVVVQAHQLPLPSLPKPTSLLIDPNFLSLILTHSDNSLSLYPPLPTPTPTSLLPPQTLIPPPTSSSTFLHLHQNHNPTRLLFLVSSPYLAASSILLRFFLLKSDNTFAKPSVICHHRSLRFDENKEAVVFGVSHGVKIVLAGSVNVFVLYSVSNRKVWVFGVKMVGEDSIKLVKCGVIECCAPVFSIRVSLGFLILGEDSGVRVFPLRLLVKGRVKKHIRQVSRNLNDKLEGQRLNLSNGSGDGSLLISSNGHLEEKIDKHSNSAKLRSVKLRQDSAEGGVCFVAFKTKESEGSKSTKASKKSAKAISIQVLSPNKFLILDSVGDLRLLSLSNPVPGSEIPCHMKQLTLNMKVQMLAVLPDISTRVQTVWISDGLHTVHTMAISDMDTSVGESDKKDDVEKLLHISVIQAIFASEKIQDIVPLSVNTILILGQVPNEPTLLVLSSMPTEMMDQLKLTGVGGCILLSRYDFVCHYMTEVLSSAVDSCIWWYM
ncbi:hypothetical protein LguiB_033159 [Lonicera macranthoides]